MARTDGGRLVIRGVRGRDGGTVAPLDIPQGLMAEVLNMELDGTGIGTKRAGSVEWSHSSGFPSGTPLNIFYYSLNAFPINAYLLGISTATIGRTTVNGGTWASLTLTDAVTGTAATIMLAGCTSFNGKAFIWYDTAVDRMHVLDIDRTSTTVRRMGLAAPGAAPTVADGGGAGAYAATQRWYQQSYRTKSGSTVVAEGERSASVAFTPSGANLNATVTKAATISEGETHWVLWASETGTSGPFYELAETVVGTTTYADTTAPADYDNGTAAQEAGTFSTLPSAKYVINDGANRLLLAGAFESGVPTSRVWFTPALGSLSRGDDERYVNTASVKHYIDLEENEGGGITGLGGPLNGHPIVFKERQIWRLIPTGDVNAPYFPQAISKELGCINHRSIAMGQDETGAPALYFAGRHSVYRLGANGIQDIGFDVKDLFDAFTSSDDAFGVYYPWRQQYWLHLKPTNADTVRARFHVRQAFRDDKGRIRGGWVKDSSTLVTTITAAATFSWSDDPATPQPRVKPYFISSAGEVYYGDSGAQDNSANFQAYVETPPMTPAGVGVMARMGVPVLVGKSSTGTPTITAAQLKNYSAETRNCTAELATTRSHVKTESGGLDDSHTVAYRIGDGSAQNSGQFVLDALIVAWQPSGEFAEL